MWNEAALPWQESKTTTHGSILSLVITFKLLNRVRLVAHPWSDCDFPRLLHGQ